MKKTDQNIIMITAGGVGVRVGEDIPKQYLPLAGKPVIQHVIEACRASRTADAIVVAAAPEYHDMLRERYGVEVCTAGDTLNHTKRNGFDYIREHSGCRHLVVAQSAQPTVTAEAIDRVFACLEEGYDAVSCARKITDSLGSCDTWRLDRERFYTMNPPQGFRFSLLDRCFDPESPLTESIQQLPETSQVKLLFDMPYFDKITYAEDLERMEALLAWRKHKTEEAGESK